MAQGPLERDGRAAVGGAACLLESARAQRDAADAERAGQKLLELQSATMGRIGDGGRMPRCEDSIVQARADVLGAVVGQWGRGRRAGGVRDKNRVLTRDRESVISV